VLAAAVDTPADIHLPSTYTVVVDEQETA